MEAISSIYRSEERANTNIKYSFVVDLLALLFIQFAGAALGIEIVSIIGVAIFSLYVAYKYRSCSYNVVIIGIYLLVFQNFAIGIGAHLGGNHSTNLSFLTQVATVYIFINAFYVIATNKLNKANCYAIFVTGMLLLFFLLSKATFMSKLVYFRNYSLAPLSFIICYRHLAFPDHKSDFFKKFIKAILNLSLIVFVFGIIMYFLPYEAWKLIGIEEVYIAKGDTTIVGNFNGRFTTGFVNGISIFRMASLYYEPVNLGYFFVFALVAAFIYRKYFNKKSIFFIIMNLVGLIMTFGKGAYLLLACVFAIAVVFWIFAFKKRKLSTVAFSSLLVFFVVFGLLWIYYKRIGGAASPHFWGIERTFASILSNPLGYGLGSGGNFAEGGMDFSAGAETGLLSMIYQLGVLGFIFILIMFLIITKNACKTRIKILIFIPLTLLFVSIFQENTFTPQCLIPLICLCSIRFFDLENKKI